MIIRWQCLCDWFFLTTVRVCDHASLYGEYPFVQNLLAAYIVWSYYYSFKCECQVPVCLDLIVSADYSFMYTILHSPQCRPCSGFTSLPLEIKCQKCKQGRPNLAVLVLSSSRCIDIREASTNSCSSIHLEYTKVVRSVIHSFIRLFAQQGRRQKLMEGVSTFLPLSPSSPLPLSFSSPPLWSRAP